jgi:hypothetical protein
MDWIMRISDGNHFCNSSIGKVWGCYSDVACNKNFMKKVSAGDRLWFVTKESHGRIVAVATFTKHSKRETGPLISLTPTNEERGWTETDGNWDTDIFYENLYLIAHVNLFSHIKSPLNVRTYNEKCKVNLPDEYPFIVKYLKPVEKISKTDLFDSKGIDSKYVKNDSNISPKAANVSRTFEEGVS